LDFDVIIVNPTSSTILKRVRFKYENDFLPCIANDLGVFNCWVIIAIVPLLGYFDTHTIFG
jgi:hypothetical protein